MQGRPPLLPLIPTNTNTAPAMNPDQIQALIKDLEDRATQATRDGNPDGEHYYGVAVLIVREHRDAAARAKTSTRAKALGLRLAR